MTSTIDPVAFAQRLIRCKSVTPEDDGALGVLQEALEPLGFTCHRMTFSDSDTPDIDNLYARWGHGGPNVCFAGHTDVVPVGDPADWSVDPFAGEIVGDDLIGRGVVDMKGAIACFVAAVSQIIPHLDPAKASISFLITGDEEGPSINGTRKVLSWLADKGERLDHCIVGEPTSSKVLADTLKVGRRGSINASLTSHGQQGHAAYPQHAANPVHPLVHALERMISTPLDSGSAHFEPSSLQVTSIDVGNPATNVIPARATAKLNVRFNDLHTGADIQAFLSDIVSSVDGRIEMATRISGESFVCPPGPLPDALAGAVSDVLGRTPELGTGGGTSDARFIKDVCPVVELGLKNATAHQVDERAALDEIQNLRDVYRAALSRLLEP